MRLNMGSRFSSKPCAYLEKIHVGEGMFNPRATQALVENADCTSRDAASITELRDRGVFGLPAAC